jgi:hypothetical protein
VNALAAHSRGCPVLSKMDASPRAGVGAENQRISEEIGDSCQKSFKLVGDKYVGCSDIANNNV